MHNFYTDLQVARRYQIHRTTIWRWISLGHFPRPVKLSPGCTRWPQDALEKWEARKIEPADTANGAITD